MYKIKNYLLTEELQDGYINDFINEIEKLTDFIVNCPQSKFIGLTADYIRNKFFTSEKPLENREVFTKAFKNIGENLAVIYEILDDLKIDDSELCKATSALYNELNRIEARELNK